MRADPGVQRRVRKSFELFLDFLGLRVDWADPAAPGAVTRSADPLPRLQNLASKPHNFMRISRLVRSLGQLGLAEWQLPLLRALAWEIFETGTLRTGKSAFIQHWIPHVCRAQDRLALEALIPASDLERKARL